MWSALFLDHPRQVGESYFEHLRKAGAFAARLLVAAVACAIHALLPGLFQKSASGIVAQLADEMARRGRAVTAAPAPEVGLARL